MFMGKYMILLGFPMLFSLPAWAQQNPYTYVEMSLLVPWTLYFVFLATVLIPFVLMVLLAWRGYLTKKNEQELEQ